VGTWRDWFCLDFSAAFDTVDHDILLRRFNASYGINGTAIQWFRSYLMVGHNTFPMVQSSLPSFGSYAVYHKDRCWGLSYCLCIPPNLIRLIERHSLHPHICADDTQVYGSCSPADVRQLHSRVSSCVDDIASWMQSNRLKLNTDKTDVLWCAMSRRQHQLPTTPTWINNDLITSSTSVRDLGVYLDADLSMRSQVHNTVSK
jgi:hypothetical protein